MKRWLIFFLFLAGTVQAQTMGGSSGPVIWSGSTGYVLPTSGLYFPYNNGTNGIAFAEDPPNGTGTLIIRGPASITSNSHHTYTLQQTGTDQTIVGDSVTQTLTNKGMDGLQNTFTNLPATGLTGVVPLASGGTNKSNTAAAGAIAFSDATTISLTAAGTSGQYLKSAGTGTPVWSAVDLSSSSVTGVLPLANGGTAKNMTAVNGGVVWTDADSQEVSAAGTSGQYLKSNGTAAPTFAAIDISTSSITGVLPLANGGTNKNMTAVAGGVVWTDSNSQEVSAVGVNGQKLRSNATSAPAFGWGSINAVSSADYTITDTDGYDAIYFTTSNSNRTVTLAAAANNTGRTIEIRKVDSGTGTVLVSGTIVGGPSTKTITLQYGYFQIRSDGTSWYWLGPISNYQQKLYNSSVTGPATLITFSNLVAGYAYRITAQCRNNSATAVICSIKYNGNIIAQQSILASNGHFGNFTSGPFLAVSGITSATFEVVQGDITGDNTTARTWATIEELGPIATATTAF